MLPISKNIFTWRIHLSVLLLLAFLLTACGGSGSGGDSNDGEGNDANPIRFTISTSAGANGNISPTSVTLDQNNSHSFNVTPDTEYDIDSVTGCGGTLTGNSYTTGPITANCTVTATFIATQITSFELIDPTPGANDKFGTQVVILASGNIVVTDPFDSNVASNNGAVHLYNPVTQTVIASFYGDDADDQLGSGGITALNNGNFVIASPLVDAGAGAFDFNFGSVQLVNGETGIQIGTTLIGDANNDQLGSGGITVLANNRFVIVSPISDENGIINAGSVQLVTGSGIPIGTPVVGNNDFDNIGSHGVTALPNNNYVVASSFDNIAGSENAGSVRLVNANGIPIGTPVEGFFVGDNIGIGGITVLPNSNYVIASPVDNEFGTSNAGSVRLINGVDGTTIGTPLAGNTDDDELGKGGITALANNNFVVASPLDDVNGVFDAGSVTLVNGTDGIPLSALSGLTISDQVGRNGVTALANSNYVITSPIYDFDPGMGNIGNIGAVHLMDGTTGSLIGALLGDSGEDQLGSGGVTALDNNNFVIVSPLVDVVFQDVGSVQLMNGNTGGGIGATLTGNFTDDQLGLSGVTALPNNNFVVASYLDNENGLADVGSVRLIDGSNGGQIGAPLVGNFPGDALGFNSVTALATNNYVVASSLDDIGGLNDLGSVRLLNGASGAENVDATITGSVVQDFQNVTVIPSDAGDFYIIAAPNANNNSMTDAGFVQLVAP